MLCSCRLTSRRSGAFMRTVVSSSALAPAEDRFARKLSYFSALIVAAGIVNAFFAENRQHKKQQQAENTQTAQFESSVRNCYSDLEERLSRAMQHERSGRVFFMQGELFDAQRELRIGILCFAEVLDMLCQKPGKEQPRIVAAAEQLLLKHSLAADCLHKGANVRDLRRSLYHGLSTCQYHLACLVAAENQLDEAHSLLEASAASMHTFCQWASKDIDTNSSKQQNSYTELRKVFQSVLMWEDQRRLLSVKLVEDQEQASCRHIDGGMSVAQVPGDTPFFLMRYQSHLVWSLLKTGKLEQAYRAMKVYKEEADSLLREPAASEFTKQHLGKVCESEGCAVAKGAAAHVPTQLWSESVAAVDVLHGAESQPKEAAQRVRLALRQRANARLACVLLSLANGSSTGAGTDWAEWQEYVKTPAYEAWISVDGKWAAASCREEVCANIVDFVQGMGRVELKQPNSSDSIKLNSDWRWIVLALRARQDKAPIPRGCPEQWSVLAECIFDEASARMFRELRV